MKRRIVKRAIGHRPSDVGRGLQAESRETRAESSDWMFGRLDVSDAPDLTRSIMGRLGYMRVPPQVARRARIRRWMARSLVMVLTIGAIGIGIGVHNSSPDVRRPAEMTLPTAIANDLEVHTHRMHEAWRLIREMRPAFEQVDWNAPAHASSFEFPADTDGDAEETEIDTLELPMIDDEVNRSAIAPVQWI